MRRMTILVTLIAAAVAATCGDSPTAPTPAPSTPAAPTPAPTPTAPIITGLSLTGPSWFVDDPTLEIGGTVQLNLDAEHSDGSTTRVTNRAAWTSSNDHVATVVAGLITGRNLGGANVSAEFEGQRVRSLSFRVERGAHVTVRNVRMEESSRSYYRVKGTVVNTGNKTFNGFLEMHSRFYDGSGLLLADDRDYVEAGGRFPVGGQRTFDILVARSDIEGWSYYTLAFTDDNDEEVACSGCSDRRR